MRKISIQDIARELGLSRNTVSNALSNSEIVSFDTKQKIIKKAIEMGYKKLSPELRVGLVEVAPEKTKNVAVLAHRDIADFWNRIILGISDELKKNNYNLLFSFVDKEDEEIGFIPSSIVNKEIDGIILLSVFSRDYTHKLLETKIPIIFLDTYIDNVDEELIGDIVLVEGESSIYQLTKRLIEKGRKRIGFVGDTNYCRTIFDRWRGYTRALYDSNISKDENICITEAVPVHYYCFEEVASGLDNIQSMPDAFVCANDDIAIYVITYLRQKGIKVPEHIAVTGFDNRKDAPFVDPTLNTVQVYNEQVGNRLVQELMWRLDNPCMPYETVMVKTKVVIRDFGSM
jgi:LacI family transcriptional regulator